MAYLWGDGDLGGDGVCGWLNIEYFLNSFQPMLNSIKTYFDVLFVHISSKALYECIQGLQKTKVKRPVCLYLCVHYL